MNLYVDECGSPAAPTILWLHGGGAAGWTWQRQLEQFADYHNLVPDLPGHGRSLDVRLESVPDAAAKLADVIRAHGGKAHIVGLSLGAQIGVALLALAPELVDHAILSGTLLRPMPGGWMYSPGLMRVLYQTSVAPFKKIDWWTRINMKYSAGIPDQYFPQFRDDYMALTADSFAQLMAVNQSYRLPAGLDRANAPTLVLAGQKEEKVIHESARDLVSALPNARGYVVQHPQNLSLAQQHNWSLNAPELFNTTVRAWLTDSPLPDALQPLAK